MLDNVCWHLYQYEGRFMAPGNLDGWTPRYTSPIDAFLGCPGNYIPSWAGGYYAYVNPSNCELYTGCDGMGADGDYWMHFRADTGVQGQVSYDEPDRWIFDLDSTGDTIAVSEEIAQMIVTETWPTSSGYPPNNDGGLPANGWAGYPTRIRIHYRSLTYSEIIALSKNPANQHFSYIVYNMRGDVIGGETYPTQILSGEAVNLSYPTTDHGGGTFIMWDIGAIQFNADLIKYVTGIEFELPGLGEQTVGSISIVGQDGTNFVIDVESTNSGTNAVHVHQSSNLPLVVHLDIIPSQHNPIP